MTETVRDAVFGNVGTMISFRVSADDAPMLAKQFEPQFEPQDLLQMHNRHFIINMVIKGEKAPAFSATTLTLPPEQIDNTGRIIENTRRHYSRTRADVEAEISEAIQVPQNLQPQQQRQPAQQSQAQAKQWPVDGGAIAVGQVIGSGPRPNTPPLADGEVKPKRKRTRSRKKKPAAAETTPGNN